MPQSELVSYYQKAKAFVFPIKWREPFGLVPVEAMSCGTPVLAYANGGVAETVIDGKTGILAEESEGVERLVEKFEQLKNIDPKVCRKHVEENFTVSKMADGYEKLFYKLTKE